MLADSPHTITVAGVTRPCFYDLRAELGTVPGSAAPQVLQIESATIKAVDFPGIAEGASVTIAEYLVEHGTYTVLRLLRAGALVELWLKRGA